jgi:SAM-dependent MidA family methyltransferase
VAQQATTAHPPELGPAPTRDALAASEALLAQLREPIRETGPLSFAEYMERVLYTPGLGYYAGGSAKIGAAGDFVTAPELSEGFAISLGDCLGAILARLKDGAIDGAILEFGAGSGRLAAGLLKRLAARDQLPRVYWILERSGELAERQRETLAAEVPELLERVEWLDRWPDTPFDGVCIANEVLDALPVRRFRWTPERVDEWCVSLDADERLVWQPQPADAELTAAVEARRSAVHPAEWPRGFTSEIPAQIGPWITGLAACLRRGAALILDYGEERATYYRPERHEGTLRCFYRHRVHGDPFRYPGLQDITASVDFTTVAEAARAEGLELLAYRTQAEFLLAAGLAEWFETTFATREREADRLALANAMKTLLLPQEMGEAVKVMALGRGLDAGQFACFRPPPSPAGLRSG